MGWLTNYSYRKKITVDSGDIDSTQTDLPVLVKLTSTNFDFSKALSTGYDIRYTSDDGETLLKFDREFHDQINTYGSDVLSGGTASGDTNGGAWADPDYVVDNNDTTFGNSTDTIGDHWWKYDLGSGVSKTVRKCRIKPYNNAWGNSVKDFKIQGSNNDSDWTDIYTGEHGNNNNYEDFVFSNSTAYRYYRVYVTSTWTTHYLVGLYEVEMMEVASYIEEGYYWVKLPSVSSSVNTDLYIYYGRAGDTDGSDHENTWSSDYNGVWHLGELSDNSVGEFLDSTSNNHDGQGQNLPTQITGIVGYGQQGGSPALIRVLDSTDWDLTGDFTFEFKLHYPSSVTTGSIMGHDDGGGGVPKWMLGFGINSANHMSFHTAGTWVEWAWTPSADTDYHCVVVRDGNDWKFYVNEIQTGGTQVNSLTVDNASAYLTFLTDGEGWKWHAGILDEVRILKGTAKDANYISAVYASDSDGLLTYGTEQAEPTPLEVNEYLALTETIDVSPSLIKITVDENLSISESDQIKRTIEQTINEALALTETILKHYAVSLSIEENLGLTESIKHQVYTSVAEDLKITEDITTNLSQISITPSEQLAITETVVVSVLQQVNYATQILHYNPLIFVTNTNPVKLVTVDISVPETPAKSVYTLTGYSNASDIALNETNDYFYINVNGAKVLKIEKADLNNVTEIDTIDTNNLLNIDTLDDFFTSYASTDFSTGEIIKIDEREIKKFNSDIRWLEEKITRFATRLNTILGKFFNTDLRFIANQTKKLRADLRWIATQYSSINDNPIDFTDVQILINGVDMVPLNDIDMETVQIIHTIDEKSQATFRLSRRHDHLDVTNTGVASQITNNNAVVIIIDGHTEFSGKIANISAESENEAVVITAKMNTPSTLMNTANIPLSSLNENISLYDCMVNDLVIDEPYVDPTDENPEYYKGIKIQLGTHIEQVVSGGRLIEVIIDDQGYYATQIENGTFLIKPGFTYFWRVDFINFITGTKRSGLGTYIGTSLGSLSSDTYKITAVSPFWQKVRDDIEIELDEWTIGEAPFQEISVKNGEKIVKGKYKDSTGGLYYGTDESYNYIPYAIEVAQLEYEKLQNINGNILPIVSNNIDVTLDAYYYYKLKLLSRINVTNTTTSNIYKNNNGFPVAVKSIAITINTDSRMMVSLQCDNQKSLQELEAIDARYPDEDSDEYIIPESYKLVTIKYDLATMTEGGFFNFPDLPTDDVFQAIMDKIDAIWPSSSS